MKCPNCNKRIKNKLLLEASPECPKCGYVFKVGDFINWDKMTHIKKVNVDGK